MRTGDNALGTLLSILIDTVSSGIVMQPNLKCFCWRDVVFTLTAVAAFPSCFRILKRVMLKCGIDSGFSYGKSPMLLAVLLVRLGRREYVLHLLFVGPRSSTKVTIVFSKIRERVRKFLTAARDHMFEV